mmetsp:Transcript_71307/g.154913  ORF Transcript_71307/g.154913 Transcript_71307/m.154913 type:complete len:110 (+) Transcript_71307:90-419(+)|eukprot:CAMPEP_0170582428 /NCGR_PEP_ID=MMETSP0224-20130122/7579_1 /TAXON_ID=285029 /ORGANISM="Togula jolla, Strain CCCM 725" /LENGTH=109 /DNA_ID=CAMNT_0010905653 /DNA_START=92 /DNA_END=421 /DNA_ORIENTATION=-
MARTQTATRCNGPDAFILILNCLFAAIFAVLAIGLMSYLDLMTIPDSSCPSGEGYAMCGIIQDFRALFSLALGGLVCAVMTRRPEDQEISLPAPDDDDAWQLKLIASLS